MIMSQSEPITFTLREYAPGDRAALEAMYGGFEPKRGAQGLPPRSLQGIHEWLEGLLPRGRHYVVVVENRVLGHVMLVPLADGKVEFANFIHQSVRGRGIGTAATRMAIERGWEPGSTLWLSVEPSNRAALRSYQRAGFQRVPGSPWAQEIEMEMPAPPAAPPQEIAL